MCGPVFRMSRQIVAWICALPFSLLLKAFQCFLIEFELYENFIKFKPTGICDFFFLSTETLEPTLGAQHPTWE